MVERHDEQGIGYYQSVEYFGEKTKLQASIELQLIIAILANQETAIASLINGSHCEDAKHPRQSMFDWNVFYKLVIQHRVWYQVAATLSIYTKPSGQNLVPATVVAGLLVQVQNLDARCNQDKLRMLAVVAETVRISKLFQKQNILHAFLKGVTLNVQLYPELISRTCKDIDLWVSADCYQQALDILIHLGYQQTIPQYTLSGFKKKYYLAHRHDIEFHHRQRNVFVELHFQINYHEVVAFYPLAPQMLRKVSILNVPVYTLNNELELLYLMIHGAIHAYTRLRWLYDVALYIKSGRCDIEKLYTYARELQSEHVVSLAVVLLKEVFKLEVPRTDNTIACITSVQGKKLADIVIYLLQNEYELLGSSNVWSRGFFAYRKYVLLLAVKGKKVDAVLNDLFKIDLLFPSIVLPDRLAFLYYVIYPFWIIWHLVGSVWYIIKWIPDSAYKVAKLMSGMTFHGLSKIRNIFRIKS